MLFRGRVQRQTIANPCSESWDSLAGGDRQRFCDACSRSVHDLSLLTRRQVADLLASNKGKVCGRISYDERGHQIFARERRPLERLMQISVLGASAVATAAAAPTCQVKVRVVDNAGAVIPEAHIKISKTVGAEAVSSGKASELGEFSGQLAPGTYFLQVDQKGFMSFRRELSCNTSETVSVEAPMQVDIMGEIIVEPESRRSSVLGKLRSLFHRN